MSKVFFAYNPFRKESKVLINNGTISPYSSLRNYLIHPWGYFCTDLIDTIKRELNDSFELEFCSGAFETFIIKALIQNRPEVSFTERPFPYGITIRDRFAALQRNGFAFPIRSRVGFLIADNIDVTAVAADLCATDDFEMGDRSIHFIRYAGYNPISLSINPEEFPADAELIIGIFADAQHAVSFCRAVQNNIPCVAVVLSDSLKVETAANKFLISMREEDFVVMMPDILESLVVCNTIETAVCNTELHFISGEERELITAIEPVVKIACEDRVQCDSNYTPTIQAYPEGSEIPEIIAVSSNPAIVRCSGSSITGVSPGVAIIDFYIKGYSNPALRKTVTVFREERINRIELSVESAYVKVGQIIRLDATVYPGKPQNIDSLLWQSDDPAVALVDQNGRVRTIAPGTCTISLSTEDVSAYCLITVAPSVESVRLQVDDTIVIQNNTIASIMDQRISIRPIAEPEDAYDTSIRYEIRDEYGAASCIKYCDGILETVGVGKSMITFISNDSNAQCSLTVEVVSTLELPRNPSKVISFFSIIAALFLAFFEPDIGIICALAAIGFACIGLTVAQKTKQRLSMIVGCERQVSISGCIALILLSVSMLILNTVKLFI